MLNVLNILTTATPRPDIHVRAMFKVVDTLLKENIQNKIYWYINLDIPSMFTEHEVEETINQINLFNNFYNQFYPNKIQITILKDHEEAHFGLAAKRLYGRLGRIEKLENYNNVFLWLEDDWAMKKTDEFMYELKKFFTSDQDFLMGTTTNKYISGHPFFFKSRFFNMMVERYKTLKNTIDPEVQILIVVRKFYGLDEIRNEQPSFKQFDVFYDVGRKWREINLIKKQNKYKQHKTNSTWELVDGI